MDAISLNMAALVPVVTVMSAEAAGTLLPPKPKLLRSIATNDVPLDPDFSSGPRGEYIVCNRGRGRIGASEQTERDPTAKDIEAECAAIRAEWSSKELFERRNSLDFDMRRIAVYWSLICRKIDPTVLDQQVVAEC